MIVYLENNAKISFDLRFKSKDEHVTYLAIYPQKNQHGKENDRPQLGQRHLSQRVWKDDKNKSRAVINYVINSFS